MIIITNKCNKTHTHTHTHKQIIVGKLTVQLSHGVCVKLNLKNLLFTVYFGFLKNTTKICIAHTHAITYKCKYFKYPSLKKKNNQKQLFIW